MSQTAASRAATAVPRFETPFLRAGVSTPGLPVLPPNVERHPVPGGGSRAVEIEAGDVISIMDVEGLLTSARQRSCDCLTVTQVPVNYVRSPPTKQVC